MLRKTELRIEKVLLQNANLTEIASAVAKVLGIESNNLIVTDVQGDVMTIDILKGSIGAYNILAKRDELLHRLSVIPGVSVNEKTSICSNGMLGWIALDQKKSKLALKRSEKIAERIHQRLSKRAIVFSTGFEIINGQVKDTNTAAIAKRLEGEGYSVSRGGTLKDDELLITAHLRQAIDDGYTLIITSGGVGAEEKDKTIEAMVALDPEAATPYVSRYQRGTGRHYKDGVKIAVGEVSGTLIIALPGPNEEVESILDVLAKGLRFDLDKHTFAEDIAHSLRQRLQRKTGH